MAKSEIFLYTDWDFGVQLGPFNVNHSIEKKLHILQGIWFDIHDCKELIRVELNCELIKERGLFGKDIYSFTVVFPVLSEG